MSRLLLGLLTGLHARGIHVAVLAGLVMMPTLVAVGFLSERRLAERPLSLAGLRPTLDGTLPASGR